MPRGDRTGPFGQGPRTGRGFGRGGMGGFRQGTGGECLCPKCGCKVQHQVGTPCYSIKCLKCGTLMTRG